MIAEFMALGTIVLLLAVTDIANLGAIFASLAGFAVWVGVFAGYKLSQRMNGPGSPLAYVYVVAITAVLRYLAIVAILPSAGGFRPEADLAQLVWPIVASIMVLAVVNIVVRLRAGKG